MQCHRTPHADFGAALSFAVSRLRGLLRTAAIAATRSPHLPSGPRVSGLGKRVRLAAVVSLLSACSSSNLHYSALEPYPSVDGLLAEHGQPDEQLVWSRNDWTGSTCEASTARVLVYHHLRGPLGALAHRLTDGGETVVCVSRDGPVSLILDVIH
ncbi:MAG: hypothetical protein JNL48_10420 [Acidobacteria bacterium]|nr:hypothetical protein [Acidobacteriota bacterium]